MIINIVIPSKGNSERLSNKNFYKINNKSLTYTACEKVLKCKNINNVYLDTDSDKLIYDVDNLIKDGLKIIKRPFELANNNITANDLMIYALHVIKECDILLQTFVTSPLITYTTIDKCIETFINSNKDSFFTVIQIQEYFWQKNNDMFKPINFNCKELPNSFDLKKIYMETHGLYGIKSEKLLEYKTRVLNDPLLITIPKIESIDINAIEDIKILEKMIK